MEDIKKELLKDLIKEMYKKMGKKQESSPVAEYLEPEVVENEEEDMEEVEENNDQEMEDKPKLKSLSELLGEECPVEMEDDQEDEEKPKEGVTVSIMKILKAKPNLAKNKKARKGKY